VRLAYFSKYFDYYSTVTSYLCCFLTGGGQIIYSYGLSILILTTESYIKFGLSYPRGMKIAYSLEDSGLNLKGKS